MENTLLQRLRLSLGLTNFHESFYKELLNCQYNYISKAFNDSENFVFIDYYIPSEIFFAMGFIPVMSEHAVNFLASLGLVDDLLVKANNKLNDSGTCSFHKPMLIAFQNGLFPHPKAFLTTTLCRESAKCFSLTASMINSNFFCIDIPFTQNEKNIEYLRNQYIALAEYLEKLSGRKLDIDKFREIVKKSNVARGYLIKGNDLRKEKVLLLGNRMLRFGGSFCYHGTDEAIDISKGYYDMLKERSDNNEELLYKHRILWSHLRPFYDNKFFDNIEKNLGLSIAFEETNYVFWDKLDENDPFLAMAQKTMSWLYAGSVERRIGLLKEMVYDYKIEGVINFAHVNCRVLNPKQYLIKKELQKINIPILELSGDCIDRRNFSANQLLTRIEAFAELLD